jgi:anaerobic selenocysteine-containing dehydrogenase
MAKDERASQERPSKDTPCPGGCTFLKSAAFLGGSAAALSQFDTAMALLTEQMSGKASPESAYSLHRAESIIYSVCLQCHTACPIRAKVFQGVLVRIDGNAYSPQNLFPQLPYDTPPESAAAQDVPLCPKGQAGIQTLYDPYRIVRVLKRSGPRGSSQWTTLSFDQAVAEIVEGGSLFSHVPGEENRHVTGLRELFALCDAALAKKMASDAGEVASGKFPLPEFKNRYADKLDLLIDPDHPDLGPRNNQLVFLAGRIEHGRKEFSRRWLGGGFGSVNWFEHTTMCGQSHHIAYSEMTKQYEGGKWVKGKTHLKPDLMNARFVLFFGTSPLEADFGSTPMAGKITGGAISGRLKFAVVDPRFNKTAAKAWKWLPIKPGTDAALAFAIMNWMFAQEKINKPFLQAANPAAAAQHKETCYTNATWLVKMEDDGPGAFLRASDIGLGDEDRFVVISHGKPVPVNLEDKAAVSGELFYEGELVGVRVKTALQLLKEQANAHSLAGWSERCGICVEDIDAVALELTSHGRQAAVELYRGPVQHTNGYYNAQTIISLNFLLGNTDYKGGLVTGGGHWHEDGSEKGQPFPLGKMHTNASRPFGVRLTREKAVYEKTTLFKGYPARRPFYPFTSNVYQEALPSAEDGYPYPIKALILHKATPGLSIPGANSQLAVLGDVDKLPLFIATDIVIGDSTMFADYIFPDLSIWERWGTPHTTPDVVVKASNTRQPIVAPIPETARVFGEALPISMEALMLGIAERLSLPGYGRNGFEEGMDFTRPEDYYLKMAANIAWGDEDGEAVPAADAEEVILFEKARQHLPPEVFDPQRFMKSIGEENWRRVITVLNRGGRWEDFTKAYKGDRSRHQLKGLLNCYVERVATAKHSMTGKRFSGIPLFLPVLDSLDRPVEDSEYPLVAITYKYILGGPPRTLPKDYWLSDILPENHILIHFKTAAELGLKDGQRVKIVSATNPEGMWIFPDGRKKPVAGKLKLIEGIRPGVIAVSWHFGHWAFGASDVTVDGKLVKGEEKRGMGLCSNASLRLDPHLKNVCLTDPIGGSTSFYDTRVRIVPDWGA